MEKNKLNIYITFNIKINGILDAFESIDFLKNLKNPALNFHYLKRSRDLSSYTPFSYKKNFYMISHSHMILHNQP